MPKFFVTSKSIENRKILITGNDVNHIKNVLRKKEGETINVCNIDMSEDYLCKIMKLEENRIQLEILEKIDNNVESNIKVSIFQGIPKADKMELIIQKSVELGVYDITPVAMQRSIVKLDEKDKIRKIQRWQKISEVAAKQCGRDIIPRINDIVNIKNICKICANYDIVIVAYEEEKQNKIKNVLQQLKKRKEKDLKIAIIIGPEGGIDATEIKQLKDSSASIVTLGNRILRTETVALNVLSMIMYEFEE